MIPEAPAPDDQLGWSVITAAVDHAVVLLGDRLLSAYAIGSLAHGGFAASVSDVDLALLTDELVPGMEQTTAIIKSEVARTHVLGDRLSVFHGPWPAFADPPAGTRLEPIDRFDLVHYGILVHGAELRAIHATEPTAGEVRAHAVDSALRRATPVRLADDLRRLQDGGVTVHDATKLVLWPVRLQHVCDTGLATGNADAVDHYLALPDADHRSLAHEALGWRELSAVPDPRGALRRLTGAVRPLHAEVFRRLGERQDIPRHRELAARARQLAT